MAIYPGAFDLDSDAVLRENTSSVVLPQVVDGLTKPVAVTEAAKPTQGVVFTGSIDQVNRYFNDRGWSDGMAIVPPTPERVQKFVEHSGYAADDEIAVMPSSSLRATPANIAANAIMAGCRPEHMPILIAAVKALADPAMRLTMTGGSTHSFIHFYLVSGPLARQLQIDHGQGLIAHPTNQVIGRAMGLIERNLAGYRIKDTQMGSFGKTPSWVLAEDEAALEKLGWPPFRVERGFSREASTVTVGSSTVWGQNLVPATSDAKTLVELLAYGVTHCESFASGMIDSRRYLMITPPVAELLAAGGYSKRSLVDGIARIARRPTYEWTFSKVHGSYGRVLGSFEEELAKAMREPGAAKGLLPPWFPRVFGWEEIMTTPAVSRGRLQIIVCGDPNRNKAQTLAGGMGGVTKEIKLPANWDELTQRSASAR
jgi:hypothetical protein